MSGHGLQELSSQAASSATHGARWMAVAAGVRMAAQIGTLVVMGRFLAPSDFGLMALASIVIAFVQGLVDAGIGASIMHFRGSDSRELSTLYILNVLWGLLLYGIVFELAPWIARLFDEGELGSVVRVASIVLVVAPAGAIFQAVMEREFRFRQVALVEMFATCIALLVAVLAAMNAWGVYALVLFLLGTTVVKTLGSALVAWRYWRPGRMAPLAAVRRQLRFSGYQMIERVLNQVGTQADKLIIGYFLGSTALGYYDVAQQVAFRPYQVLNPVVTRVALPLLAKIRGDGAALRHAFLRLSSTMAVILVPLYVALSFEAEHFVRFLVGQSWGESAPVLSVLAAVGLLQGLGNPMSPLLLALGRVRISLLINVARIVLDIVLILVVLRHGVLAVAIAVLAVRVCLMLPLGVWLRWHLIRLRAGRYLKALYPIIQAALVMLVVMLLVRSLVEGIIPVLALVSVVAAGGFFYVAALCLLDKTILQNLWSLLRR